MVVAALMSYATPAVAVELTGTGTTAENATAVAAAAGVPGTSRAAATARPTAKAKGRRGIAFLPLYDRFLYGPSHGAETMARLPNRY
jgi:hypothetical protein